MGNVALIYVKLFKCPSQVNGSSLRCFLIVETALTHKNIIINEPNQNILLVPISSYDEFTYIPEIDAVQDVYRVIDEGVV